MNETKITVCNMLIQMITGNQLSLDDELEIKNVLEKREKEREEAKRNRCLSGIIEKELKKQMEMGVISEATGLRYQSILRRCFIDTTYGNLDASSLSESVVQEFIIETHESYGLTRNEMTFFIKLLKLGLNIMSQMQLINFTPQKKMFKNCIQKEHGIHHVCNLYPKKDTDLIIEWIENHPSDTRALALGLWFSGGICPLQIINLKKEDCWGSSDMNEKIAGLDRNIFNEWKRAEIIRKAINLHPEDTNYVFMVKKEGTWRKLTEKSLQVKLYYICQSLGIKYRAFHQNEIIVCDE